MEENKKRKYSFICAVNCKKDLEYGRKGWLQPSQLFSKHRYWQFFTDLFWRWCFFLSFFRKIL